MLLTLFLSVAQAAEEAASGFTMVEMWTHAGWIARSVIVTLALMFIATLVVGVERQLAFSKATKLSSRMAALILPALQSHDLEKAIKAVSDEEYKSSYLAAMLRAGLVELNENTDAFGIDNAHRSTQKSILEEISKLRRGMTILATVGSTAPFVGLFGTTFGVINAFQGMSAGGSGLASISAGISEALITTGLGIGVAVLGVWIFNYFTQKAEKVADELTASEADFFGWATKLVHSEKALAGK